MHFITAMESSFCCRWPCIALATPIAPITSAISADQAEERGGAIQAARDDRVRLAVVGDGGFGKRLLQHRAHLRRRPGPPAAGSANR